MIGATWIADERMLVGRIVLDASHGSGEDGVAG
jgi:hypothetical protein